MAKRPNKKTAAAIRAMIRDVEDLIDGEKWNLDRKAAAAWKRHPWAGADVVICQKLPRRADPSHTYVASPYVVELSWLIDALKKACADFVDFRNKETFYGRLADAANRYLSERPAAYQNAKDLCFAVVRESMRLLEEAHRGELVPIRNSVQIKQIHVELHPGAVRGAAGIAVYRCPASRRSSLANEKFTYRGKAYRLGETTQVTPSGDHVIHTADYHEVD